MKTSMDSKLDKYLLSKCTMSLNGYAVKAVSKMLLNDENILLRRSSVFSLFSFYVRTFFSVFKSPFELLNFPFSAYIPYQGRSKTTEIGRNISQRGGPILFFMHVL